MLLKRLLRRAGHRHVTASGRWGAALAALLFPAVIILALPSLSHALHYAPDADEGFGCYDCHTLEVGTTNPDDEEKSSRTLYTTSTRSR